IRLTWPVWCRRRPKILEVVHPSESQVAPSRRHRRVVEISFFFQHAQGRFADPEVWCAKNDRADARGLLYGLGGSANPFPLLLVSGGTEVLAYFQAAVAPALVAPPG